MSFRKICRALNCCKKPSEDKNNTPEPIAEISVARIEVIVPKAGHRYKNTMGSIFDTLQEAPADKPAKSSPITMVI